MTGATAEAEAEAEAGAAEAEAEATAEAKAAPLTVRMAKSFVVASVWMRWLKPQWMHNRVNRTALKMQEIRPGSGGGGGAGARQRRQDSEFHADRRGSTLPIPNRRMIHGFPCHGAACVTMNLKSN